ncbi:MAG: pseudouridine synthase [Bradymonadaceae bacterium]
MPDEPEDCILIEDNTRVRRWNVDQNFDGWRLDKFIENRIGTISRTKAGEIAKHGDVEVIPDRKIKAGTFLRDGDVVIVREHLDPEWVQDPQVEVLYYDDSVVALHKPAGMLIHEVGPTRLNTIEKFLERRGYPEAQPAHRIDRETSGVVVCAIDETHRRRLHEMFKQRKVDKLYRALALDDEGRWSPGTEETLDTPLGDDEESEIRHKKGPGDQRAVTYVTVENRFNVDGRELADLRLKIETGRQHQIRAHLAIEGTPIAGDKLYAKSDRFFQAIMDYPDDEELNERLTFDRQALHAWRLRIPHPENDEDLELEAPFGEDQVDWRPRLSPHSSS